jgi:hypothetical protein
VLEKSVPMLVIEMSMCHIAERRLTQAYDGGTLHDVCAINRRRDIRGEAIILASGEQWGLEATVDGDGSLDKWIKKRILLFHCEARLTLFGNHRGRHWLCLKLADIARRPELRGASIRARRLSRGLDCITLERREGRGRIARATFCHWDEARATYTERITKYECKDYRAQNAQDD